MYKGNPDILGDGETLNYSPEQIQEWIKCKEDIIYFSEKYMHITTQDDGRIIIKLRDYQKKILKQLISPSDHRLNSIMMCPRQSAKTTTVTIYILHYLLFNRDKTVAILANKEDTAFEIMARIQSAYTELPLFLQQGLKELNKGSIVLSNGSKAVSKATSKGSISGLSISLLYVDEFAKIPDHVMDDFITSTLPTISQGKTAKIIISSTPKGQNAFYDFWVRAIRGKSDFYPIKVNWWEVYSQEFKDATIRNYGEAYWLQEYSLRFIGSTNTLIDPDILEKMIADEPLGFKYGELLKIWHKPVKDAKYIIGVDSGKGLGKNFSVLQILRIYPSYHVTVKNDKGEDVDELVEPIEQVALYRHNKISPHNYADVAVDIAKYYNSAYLMIENNNDCGGIVGERIWYDLCYEYVCNFEKMEIGVRSTKKSKLVANLLLKKFVESGMLKIHDKDTIDELGKYVEVSLNVFKGETRDTLDDCVTALLWAIYFLRTHYSENFKGSLDSDISQEIQEEYNEGYDSVYTEYEDNKNISEYSPSFYIT